MSRNIAIVLDDTLAAIGLRQLLGDAFDVSCRLLTPADARRDETVELSDYIITDLTTAKTLFEALPHRHERLIVVVSQGESLDGMPCASVVERQASSSGIIDKLSTLLTSDGPRRDSVLSQREKDVLRLIARGYLNKEIANELFISINTVLSHRKNITAKLGIKSVSGLTFYAMMNDLT